MRRLALALAAAIVVPLAILVASAASDRPASTVNAAIVIDASRGRVWEVVSDFGAYDEWNPVVTRASGPAQAGATLSIRLEEPGRDPVELEPELSIVRVERKLRWQTRLYLPGIRDREQETKIDKLGPQRVRVRLQDRVEGVLAPFAGRDARRASLRLVAAALKRRAEAA